MTIEDPVQSIEPTPSANGQPLLEAEHLKIYFPIRKGLIIDRKIGQVHAVDDVSFALREGETLGIVGSRAAVRAP